MSGSLQSRNVGWGFPFGVRREQSRIRALPGRADPVLLSEGEVAAGQALAIAFLLVLRILLSTAPSRLLATMAPCCDVRVLVEEDAVGELLSRVADLDASILVLVDAAALARRGSVSGPGSTRYVTRL